MLGRLSFDLFHCTPSRGFKVFRNSQYDSVLEAYLYITWKQGVLRETIFHGYPAFEVLVGGYGQNYSFFIEKDGLIYNIDFPFAGDKEHFNDIEKTILATFRFVDGGH